MICEGHSREVGWAAMHAFGAAVNFCTILGLAAD